MATSLLKRFCRTSRTLPQVRGDGRRNDGFPPQPPQSGACSMIPLTDPLGTEPTKGTDPRPPETSPSTSPPVGMVLAAKRPKHFAPGPASSPAFGGQAFPARRAGGADRKRPNLNPSPNWTLP